MHVPGLLQYAMITRITGVLESIEGTVATVALVGGGLAYEVLIPAYLAHRLRSGPGSPSAAAPSPSSRAAAVAAAAPVQMNLPVTLHTLEYLEGQGQGTSFIPRLIGFASPAEREFFDLLTSVKGLGNKRTLRALAVEPGSVVQAIVGRDARRLQDLPEIGKKLAETIILELRDKAQRFAGLFGVQPEPGSGSVGASGFIEERFSAQAIEAISALTNLGEQQPVAEQMVLRALRHRPELTSADEIISAAYAARVP